MAKIQILERTILRCIHMKWIQPELWVLQSGHGMWDGRTDKRRDRRTDGRTEWNQYTPQQLCCAGGIINQSITLTSDSPICRKKNHGSRKNSPNRPIICRTNFSPYVIKKSPHFKEIRPFFSSVSSQIPVASAAICQSDWLPVWSSGDGPGTSRRPSSSPWTLTPIWPRIQSAQHSGRLDCVFVWWRYVSLRRSGA